MELKNIKSKIHKRLFKIYLKFRVDIKPSKINKETTLNNKTYQYLLKKYRKNLENLPDYSKEKKEYSNKVWWCWFQGENNAPDIIKACLQSLRKNLKDRDIIVITLDNYKEYIEFPDYITDKVNKGIITLTHFSDLLRLQLLIKYGGTWIDSSVYCTNYNKDLFDKDLFVYKAFMRGDESMSSSSWFITSCTNNPILLATRDLLFQYWQDHDYLMHYFLFHLFFNMACHKYEDIFAKVENYPNVIPHILQFELFQEYNEERLNTIKKLADFHKLTYKFNLKDKKSNNTFYDYIVKSSKKDE